MSYNGDRPTFVPAKEMSDNSDFEASVVPLVVTGAYGMMGISCTPPDPLPLPSQQSVASVKNTYSYKGVEYTFVDTVPEDLVCPICHQLLDEAQQTPCGHLFCKKCLKNAKGSGKVHAGYFRCPLCRAQHSCKTSEAMNDKYNERRVTSLRVKCPKSQCDWVGSVGTVDNHKRIHCLFENVSCSKGCGTFVLRCNLQSHIDNECRLRTSFCKFCHQKGTHEFITTDHCRECDKYPIECPNQCGETVAQKKIETHLGKCPMQDIECRYSLYGCTTVTKRSETEQHEAQHKDYHLQLSFEKMSLLFQTVADMYSSIQSLSEKLAAVERQPRGLFPYPTHYSPNSQPVPLPLPPNPLASFTRLRRPWLENKTLFPSSPWIFKLNNFERQRSERKVLYWKLFSHPVGYKFVVRAEAESVHYDDDFYISAYCYTEDGPNDSTLKWPFSGSVTVTLLNQAEDRYHITHTIPLRKEMEDVKMKKGRPQVACARNSEIVLAKQKTAHDNCQYLKDDCLFLRIEIVPKFA